MRPLISAIRSAVSKQNKTAIPYSAPNVSVLPFSVNSSEREMAAMGAVGILFSIVNKNATSIASTKWHLVRDPSPRARVNTEPVEVTNHLALDIWNKPNDFFGQNEFVETFQQHLDLTGEAWWVVKKTAGIPMSIWPARPDRMEIIPDPDRFISHYIYRSPSGQSIRLEIDEVIQLRMPNPLDIYRGMGPVQSVLADIDSTKYSAEWNKNFFLNSAEPGGIVKYDHALEDDEFKRVTNRWREQHQGVAQAHRVAVIEDGAEWIDRKFTMQDMQFKELRDVSREIIREAFGFPKPMLGTVEDVNRANAEATEVIYARWTLIPRLERIKSALNNEFLPMFKGTGEGVHFEYESPVPEDVATENATLLARAQAASLLIQAGFKPADVLSVVELPEMAFEPPKPVAPPAAPGQGSGSGGNDQQPNSQDMENLIKGLRRNSNFTQAMLNSLGR
jgi:HK97 family phage portal protein